MAFEMRQYLFASKRQYVQSFRNSSRKQFNNNKIMGLLAIILICVFISFAWFLKILRKENLKLENELIQLQNELIQLQNEIYELTISNKELLNANYKLSKKININQVKA